MAFNVPTVGDLLTRYPIFASLSTALVQAVLDEAASTVGTPDTTRWLERDYAPAIMLLTAHTLVVDGAFSGGGGTTEGTYAGPITKEKVGDVEISYGSSSSDTASPAGNGSGFEATEYGRRYLRLMRGNFGGPMVV